MARTWSGGGTGLIRGQRRHSTYMSLYFDVAAHAAESGSRLAHVHCERCGCDYAYELARVGRGRTAAPYGIGLAAARQGAREQAEQQLAERLQSEAELVPCPKCHWINEDLVRGYRLSRYRLLGPMAAAVAFFGSVASLIGAWFVAIGPAADRGALPYFLYVGPAVFITIGTSILLVRNWWRSRIRPNRDFPLPPTLPAGTPPALILDGSRGQFVVVERAAMDQRNSDEWHEFQVGRHRLPELCCWCLHPSSPPDKFIQHLGPASHLDIPQCAICARRARRIYWSTWLLAVATTGLIAWITLVFAAIGVHEFWIVLGACVVLSMAGASFLASGLTAPVRVKVADDSRGILRLRFRNPGYQPVESS